VSHGNQSLSKFRRWNCAQKESLDSFSEIFSKNGKHAAELKATWQMLLRELIWILNFQMHAPNWEHLIGCFKARDFRNIFSANALKRKYLQFIFLNWCQYKITDTIMLIKTFLIYWNVALIYLANLLTSSEAWGPHLTLEGLIGLWLGTGEGSWEYFERAE